MKGEGSRGRVLLINPGFPFPYNRYLHPQDAVPLGLLVLAASLEKDGFEVRVLDLARERLSRSDVIARCRELSPHVVGISLNLSYRYGEAKALAEMINRGLPEASIWFGGNHATHLAEQVLADVPSADGVILGLGETTFPAVCRSLVDKAGELGSLPGVVYRRKHGQIERTTSLPVPREAFHFVEPAWHLVDMHKYDDKGYIIGSRGCPYSCQFCSSHAFHGVRTFYREIDAIVEEMLTLKRRFGLKFFRFVDDSFTVDRERAAYLCERIASTGVKLDWSCNTRIDLFEAGLFREMAVAGCRTILFGVESLNERVLKLLRKGYSSAQALEVLRKVRDMGISTQLSFVIGLPEETFETAKDIKSFVEQSRPSETSFNILKLYPGTEFFRDPARYGLNVLHTDWRYVEHVLPMVESQTMNGADQMRAYVYLVREAGRPKTRPIPIDRLKSVRGGVRHFIQES